MTTLLTQTEYETLPENAKPFFTLQENGNAAPVFEPEQVQQTQEQLRQEAILAKQQVAAKAKELEDFLTVLPKELQDSPKDLGDYFIKTNLDGTPGNTDQQALEEKLHERDNRHKEERSRLEKQYQEEKASLKKENDKLKKAEVERVAFEAMQVVARKHKLLPKYDTSLFAMNRNHFDVSDSKLFITDPDGLASGTTVDKFFTDKKEAYPEMFEGSGMSGSGATPQYNTSVVSQGKVRRNNWDMLNNLKEIADGSVKVI